MKNIWKYTHNSKNCILQLMKYSYINYKVTSNYIIVTVEKNINMEK